MASDGIAAVDLAIQLMQSEYNVSCTLIIENDTDHKMINPVTNIHNGSIKVPPAVIKEHKKGVIGAHKTAYSVMGCGADITWNLEDKGISIRVDFGIAGGGWSWMNANHLELAIFDENHSELGRERRTFKSGEALRTCVANGRGVILEGTMGNTDCCEVRITVREK